MVENCQRDLLLLALLVVGLGNERALVVATRSNTWGTLDSCFQLATQGVPLAVHLSLKVELSHRDM